MTPQEMFSEAVLVQLSMTCWQMDKKIPSVMLQQIGNVDYLKGRKVLLDPFYTQNIKAVIGKARNYLRKICLPFPIAGCLLLPKHMITEINNKLNEFKASFEDRVIDFQNNYDEAVKNAKYSLGELFDSKDYPSKELVSRRFKFVWRYITVGQASSRVLPYSLYKEESEKFKEMINQAEQEAIIALREEFSDLVSNITDKLNGSTDGKQKRLRDAAIENLNEFLDNFSKRNMFKDEELNELVNRCHSIINGVTPDTIRKDMTVKQELHEGFGSLLEAINDKFDDLPKRKIRLVA